MINPRHPSKALLGAFFLSVLCVAGIGQTPVESPVGTFVFENPPVPTAAPYPITEMASLNGSYLDNSGGSYLNVTVDLAMDESGKVIAMGVLPGFTSRRDVNAGMTDDSDNVRTLFVRTINGEPVLTAKASAAGEFDEDGTPSTDEPATNGAGQADIFLGSFPPVSDPNFEVVPVRSSFRGSLDGERDRERPSMSFLFLDPDQVRSLTKKNWSMVLTISEELSSGARPIYFATLTLVKPNNTEVRFAKRRVNYSAKFGYTIDFSNGVKYVLGAPVRVDRTTSVKFSNLLFKKVFNSFEPAAGGVNYRFLGQKGFGHVFNFDAYNDD